MVQFDALTTKNSKVVRAVKVFHSLWVFLTQILGQLLVFLGFKIETSLGQYRVFLNNFIQDVDVEWKALWTVELLHKLPANGASHAVFMVKLVDAVSAKSVTAVHQNARNAFANIVLECAKLADVETA